MSVHLSISQPELWHRLADYTPGPEAAHFGFVQRLSEENDWSLAYARRVLGEYRRFAYLACVAPQIMTPPDAVDQAWHLHLTYSRDYWHRFCPEVLWRDLHHGPTEGGGQERRRYLEAYQATLALYAEEFGTDAPADIWPDPRARFSPSQNFKRIDTSRVIRLPKPSLAAWGLIGAGLMLSGCKVLGFVDDIIVPVLIFVVVFAFVIGSQIAKASKSRKTDDSGSTSSSCSSTGCSGGSHHNSSNSDSNDSSSSSSDSNSSSSDSGCGGGGCGGGGD